MTPYGYALIGGFLVFLAGGFVVYVDLEAESWPTVSAQVTASHVVSEYRYCSRHYSLCHSAEIEYAYSVDGIPFTGSCCTYSSYNPDHAEALVAQHPVGAAIDVFVNPQQPAQSRLPADIDWLDYVLMLSIAGLGLGVMIFGLFGLRSKLLLNQSS